MIAALLIVLILASVASVFAIAVAVAALIGVNPWILVGLVAAIYGLVYALLPRGDVQ